MIQCLEKRLTESAIAEVFCKDVGSSGFDTKAFDEFFGLVLNSAPATSEAVSFFRRIVRSKYFPPHRTRNTLIRLCEIDPDHWVDHFQLMREKVRELLTRLVSKGIVFREEQEAALSLDIYNIIGFDRFGDGFGRLFFEYRPSMEESCDNWFFRSVFERLNVIQVQLIDGVIIIRDSNALGCCEVIKENKPIHSSNAKKDMPYIRPFNTIDEYQPLPDECVSNIFGKVSIEFEEREEKLLETV